MGGCYFQKETRTINAPAGTRTEETQDGQLCGIAMGKIGGWQSKDIQCDKADAKYDIQCTWSCGLTDSWCSGGSCNEFDTESECNEFSRQGCRWFKCIDRDGDGAASRKESTVSCFQQTGFGRDCDDNDPDKSPLIQEICGDGKDNNCNTHVDEAGCIPLRCEDSDKDGYGTKNLAQCRFNKPDCNDENADINPGTKEVCTDGIDNDCDLGIDASDGDCALCTDNDDDGYGATGTDISNCRVQGFFDCDDSNVQISPGKSEIAYDGIDNDCDKSTKDDDLDGDNYNTILPPGVGTFYKDCDDKDPFTYPAAPERCDGKDNNCDSAYTDAEKKSCSYQNSCGTWNKACAANELCKQQPNGDFACAATPSLRCSADSDRDGYCGKGWNGQYLYADGSSVPKSIQDCQDQDANINPSKFEYCLNNKDDDCDGQIDLADQQGCINLGGNVCLDDDKDGAPKKGSDLTVCVNKDYDCDDGTSGKSPYKLEVCDGVDNDCNNKIDDLDKQLSGAVSPNGQTYSSLAGTKKSQGVCQISADSSYVSCVGGKWQWDYTATAAQYGWTYETEEGNTNTNNCNDGHDNDCDSALDCQGESANSICNQYCADLAAQTSGQQGQGQGAAGGGGYQAG